MNAKTTIIKRRWLSLKCSKPMPGSSMALVSSIQSLPETESQMQSCWYDISPTHFTPGRNVQESLSRYGQWSDTFYGTFPDIQIQQICFQKTWSWSKIRRMDRRLSHRHRYSYNRDRAKPRGGGGYYWLLTGWAPISLLTYRQGIPVSAGLKLRLISSDTGRQGIPVSEGFNID